MKKDTFIYKSLLNPKNLKNIFSLDILIVLIFGIPFLFIIALMPWIFLAETSIVGAILVEILFMAVFLLFLLLLLRYPEKIMDNVVRVSHAVYLIWHPKEKGDFFGGKVITMGITTKKGEKFDCIVLEPLELRPKAVLVYLVGKPITLPPLAGIDVGDIVKAEYLGKDSEGRQRISVSRIRASRKRKK